MNSPLALTSPVTDLKGVGVAVAEKLNAKGIMRVADLLFILPLRYVDKTKITPIANTLVGQSVQLCVTIQSANIRYGGRRSLHLVATDSSGTIDIRLFHFGKSQLSSLTVGASLLVYGQVSAYKNGVSMMHPEYKVLKSGQIPTLSETLTSIYPSVGDISTKRLSDWIAQAVTLVQQLDYQEFSEDFLREHRLSDLTSALAQIHQPSIEQGVIHFDDASHPALRRLVLDEVLSKQLALITQRQTVQIEPSMPITIDEHAHQAFLSALPFTLTNAQTCAIHDIFTDIAKPIPMHRLVQGDVGSGKTLVAFSACKQASKAGLQSVLMAPTEILAEQHFIGATRFLAPHGLTVVRLSGKLKAAEKRDTLVRIASSEADVIVGTHALFQDDVAYHRLGLVIIDEQHRFGVQQRLQLRDKTDGYRPHLLVMTATPIPRTLAMSYYADLHTSIIDERPPGRQPITTVTLPASRLSELSERIASLCAQGRQAYWVCALIGESEHLNCAAAEDRFAHLQAQLPNLRIGLLHGQLATEEKAETMQRFADGEIDVMVSTTVIEVGVDVPNAVLMVIENAERFGLAQLHQLRGRVGRGEHQSFCVLLYQEPLSDIATQRLTVIKENDDGFKIANEDLRIRGAGEMLGTRQTGEMAFRITDIERDAALLELGYAMAEDLIATKPKMVEEILTRWQMRDKEYLNV